jgi:8-oxo-dGTP pyrophosphatase MutT (NUDIX family)
MLPKWRIKLWETLKIGAIREIQEETGLYGFTLGNKVGVLRDRKRRKKITFFEVKNAGIHSPVHDEAIMWVSIEHALKHLKHDGEKKLIEKYVWDN